MQTIHEQYKNLVGRADLVIPAQLEQAIRSVFILLDAYENGIEPRKHPQAIHAEDLMAWLEGKNPGLLFGEK